MVLITLAAGALTEYAAATMATLGVIGAVWGTARIVRNGKARTDGAIEAHARYVEGQLKAHDAKLGEIGERLGGVREAVGEVHGILRMLPCVRDGRCDQEGEAR